MNPFIVYSSPFIVYSGPQVNYNLRVLAAELEKIQEMILSVTVVSYFM